MSDSETFQMEGQVAPQLKQCRTATRHKVCEKLLDLSVHEDLPEKTVYDSYSHGEWRKGTRRKPDSICKICEAEYGTECQLSAHMKSLHPEDRLYLCSEYKKAFNTHNDLNTHVLSVHRLSRLSSVNCVPTWLQMNIRLQSIQQCTLQRSTAVPTVM